MEPASASGTGDPLPERAAGLPGVHQRGPDTGRHRHERPPATLAGEIGKRTLAEVCTPVGLTVTAALPGGCGARFFLVVRDVTKPSRTIKTSGSWCPHKYRDRKGQG